MRLEDLQRMMIAAIDHGPDHVFDGAFVGGGKAALRGLSVHANTISHARLVAIEETFPRTRVRIGEAQFNAVSRDYVEMPGVCGEVHSLIGRRFPAFLASAGLEDAAALAAFEWAWLEAYHAAEAEAIELTGLAGMSAEQLLATRFARHPAARLSGPVRDEALECEFPGLGQAAAILITRPATEVMLATASPAMASQFEILAVPQPVCNLLDCGDELSGEDGLKALLAMLEAGSLILARSQSRTGHA